MASEQIEEVAEQIQKCVKWSKGWSEANPDPVVAEAVGDGLVTLGCLPKGRLQRMLKNETLEPQDLSEGQMHFLNQKGLLDPEEAETVGDGDEEEEADDGGISIDDLDEEERERLVEEIEKEVERRVADDNDDGDDDDENAPDSAEEEAAGLEEFQDDDQDDGDDGMISASEAM